MDSFELDRIETQMPDFTEEALRLAKILWDYLNIPNNPSSADIVLALGSSDTRVAHEAARLTLEGIAPLLVISGGVGKVTSRDGGTSESARFAKIALESGVSIDRLILESTATNTGENFTRTRSLLDSKGIFPCIVVFVTKPYMKRRALATAIKQWPEVTWIPHAPDIAFEDYPDETISQEQMIQLMVGDLQRIAIYPKLGFQAKQKIPLEVWTAYEALVALGFDKYVIRD
jgi:uncharacterized SAM-binding protein YcdF (DUF218 family)